MRRPVFSAFLALAGVPVTWGQAAAETPPPPSGGALTPPASGPTKFSGIVYDPKELDSPPTPTLQVKPVYPPSLRTEGMPGWVEVAFVLDETGRVHAARVISSSRPEFEAPAIAAVLKWKYRPGKIGNRPAGTRLTARVEFRP